MSKSLKRVKAEAETLGLAIEIVEKPEGTLTAADAAKACGCEIGQIAKSIVLRDESEIHYLIIISGAYRVNVKAVEAILGADLRAGDAASIRKATGFAIGGVSPLGSKYPVRKFIDASLLRYNDIFAAAGTPSHLFKINTQALIAAINAEIIDVAEQ